ncbi:aldo/keto reductase [Curtobacterium flaccumfaciens]|uniref:aldo/keto reductase n=1 Tax=Curtobacterium flaccumfaciens TaxID=2035 RepID=UPI000FFEB68F|nr:aldo/keto reductase [Curtobacterium flaccumfaciens]MCS0647077.1 aldo/keto reductase [Curtobacterium flaccumfaciens pv. flaccumfaciens]MCS6524672.1 aldo/keto reductase [Curtobacterium flaccumfaciens pv. flaccumfaciens]MCS6529818.1 aldo/keto reductase [Curtobacterium flaccumfaciens pv. flaccumfaciens]NUU11268.1 aldo/keto reductase [Curtobacterium flaccumfaciens]RXF84732.1 alcohol dehydrogenase [Curtobacterium flaccumfaciens pv. flaccumfaciens]
MEYTKLGTTGLDVSPIAIGAMTYGEPDRGHPVWSKGEDEARPLIKHALDAGINFFDTANMYSNGSSEEILGRALKDYANRDDVVIATKLRHPMRPGPNGKGLSRKAIMTEVDHSLERLGTDYIDLYQVHRNDHATPLEETLEALSDLVKAGKVRYLGASSMFAWEFAKALHMQKTNGWARFVSMQDHYNLLAREEEREMIPLALDEGVGTIIWSPLARGRLARAWDKARSTARSDSDGDYADLLYSPAEEESNHQIIDAVGQVAERHGVSRASIALAWLHRQPVVTAPLVGAGSTQQIDDAIASLDVQLTDEDLTALTAPYTPRYDWQGVSDEATMNAIRARVPGMALK